MDATRYDATEAMQAQQPFEEAIQKFDAANLEDPRTEMANGGLQPREWLFAKRVYQWVQQLVPNPSEELLLAAQSHTLRRWLIPRDRYPQTRVGYHQWRDALAQFHAEQAEAILQKVGYPPEKIQAVKALITKANWPANPEACALEDADCLVFLEFKLAGYVDAWGEKKTVRILRQTIKKMTPDAQSRALKLNLGPREQELVLRAARTALAQWPAKW